MNPEKLVKLVEYFSSFDRMPAVPILGYPALAPLGLTTFECLTNPEKHAKLCKYVIERFEIDALLPLLDLTVEAEILGAEVLFTGREAPQIVRHIDLEKLGKKNRGRMHYFLETVRIMKNVSRSLPVGAYVTGPFTVAGQTIELTRLLKFMRTRREDVLTLLKEALEISLEYATSLKESGADFIVIAEPSSSLVSKQDFEAFSKPFLKRIASSISGVILHMCGKSGHLLPSVVDMGIEGLSIDQNIKLEEAVSIVPDNMLVFGNYSPKSLVVEKPEEIRRNVVKMLAKVKNCRNVVSSTGCDIPAAAPEENIVAFVEASKSFRRKIG